MLDLVPSWVEKGTQLKEMQFSKTQQLTKEEIEKVPSWEKRYPVTVQEDLVCGGSVDTMRTTHILWAVDGEIDYCGRMVEEVFTYSPQGLADLDSLMHELSATSFCNEELLRNALNDVNVHVYVIRDGEHISSQSAI